MKHFSPKGLFQSIILPDIFYYIHLTNAKNWVYYIQKIRVTVVLDKGKPAVRRGRKAARVP
ncbi:MAG: hypothetical protein AMS15_05035 [Planctomycetes bacterium DG_23]|nr:MAG: hypothetical protein AMS15_05035 [Planctomycetes bacterium DG_23]